jgi:hypothetical protein
MNKCGFNQGVQMKLSTAVFIFFILLTALFSTNSYASWLLYHKPDFNGRVIDAGTKEPIHGAVVVAAYYKTTLGVPHRYSDIIYFQEALTDKDGYFHIPSYTTLIQPLSWSNIVAFIIYKPGYGNFPEQQIIPYGLTMKNEEEYFSRAIGSRGILEMWVRGDNGLALKKLAIIFGVVELPKLSTKEERIKAMIAGRPGILTADEAPLYYKEINEERSRLGLSGVDK